MSRFMPFMSDVELIAIGQGLIDLTLPRIHWTHDAHFVAALWLIETGRSATMPAMIRAYNESVGVANTDHSGYHETITQASLQVARAFRLEREHLPLFRVCNELMESPLGRSSWLLKYWSKELLFSVEARRRWVEPDLCPFLLIGNGNVD